MHQEYKRITGLSDKAILFIHGIVGTPEHFNEFIKLVPEHISIHNILLDGHGKKARDFSKTSMEKWKNQVAQAVEDLAKEHKEIYIVAHSLGGLLAMEQAITNPKITKMFLLAVPLKLFLRPKMFINSLKVYAGRIKPEDKWAVAAKNCYGIQQDKNPFHYLGWIPRFIELFAQMRKTRKTISLINIPTVTYQSMKDEMVSKKSIEILKQNPNIVVNKLENSGHYYYEENDFSLLKTAFGKFVS